MPESQEQSKKTKYFQRRATSHLTEMRLAKDTGLFPKKEGWRNVVEHMVVEAEAADVLAEALGIPESERKNLYTATLLHDVFKRKEIELAQQKGASGFDESAKLQSEWLRGLGYSQGIIELTESVAHTSLVKFQKLDEVSLSQKIIHYVDDIIQNNDLVKLEQRMNAQAANPRYAEINQQGIAIFGKPYIEVSREVSKKLEAEFAQKIGLEDPTQLPIWIRDRIFSRIALSG